MAQASQIMGVDYIKQVEFQFTKNDIEVYTAMLILSAEESQID